MGLKAELVKETRYPGYIFRHAPRNVYWEMTIACDLECKHCRASAIPHRDPLELSTEEAEALLRDVKEMGSMIVLTGGDPMKRPDLFDLIAYGREIGLPVSITPSTTPTLTREVVERFKELGEHPLVGEVRGVGMLGALELVEDRASKEPSPGKTKALLEAAKEEGLLIGVGGLEGNVIRIGPSMLVSVAEVEDALDRLRRACRRADSAS